MPRQISIEEAFANQRQQAAAPPPEVTEQVDAIALGAENFLQFLRERVAALRAELEQANNGAAPAAALIDERSGSPEYNPTSPNYGELNSFDEALRERYPSPNYGAAASPQYIPCSPIIAEQESHEGAEEEQAIRGSPQYVPISPDYGDQSGGNADEQEEHVSVPIPTDWALFDHRVLPEGVNPCYVNLFTGEVSLVRPYCYWKLHY